MGINKNCYISRTSDDTNIKLGPVPELATRNKTKSKNVVDDVMSANVVATAISPIDGQFGTIQKPDSGRMICKN